MSTTKMRVVKCRVPEDVAEYFEARANYYGVAVQAATGPVLTAMARGEIRQEFTQQPGTDTRPR